MVAVPKPVAGIAPLWPRTENANDPADLGVGHPTSGFSIAIANGDERNRELRGASSCARAGAASDWPRRFVGSFGGLCEGLNGSVREGTSSPMALANPLRGLHSRYNHDNGRRRRRTSFFWHVEGFPKGRFSRAGFPFI